MFPKELGAHLGEFTIRRITEPELPPQQLVMPTELIRRETCAKFHLAHISPAALQKQVSSQQRTAFLLAKTSPTPTG